MAAPEHPTVKDIILKSMKTKVLPPLASAFDYEEYAKMVLDPSAWNYFSCGATEEITLRDNVAAYRRMKIFPNRLVDVSTVRTSQTIKTFGGKVSIPIGIAPTANHAAAHKEAEIGTAKAAENLGTVMIVSNESTTWTQDIAQAVPGVILWQQMYLYGDRKDNLHMIDLAEKSNAKALVVTIDRPSRLIMYQDQRGLIKPGPEYPNYPPDLLMTSYNATRVSWIDFRWLTLQTKLPVIVKGVLTAFEARQAVDHGASAIFVSNHGGRALDGVPATIDQLAKVVAEVKKEVPVYLDGGIRTGMDVFKALALGADMVFLGRAVLWGLAYDGQRGVEKVVNQISEELINTMELAGAANISAIKPELVYSRQDPSKL